MVAKRLQAFASTYPGPSVPVNPKLVAAVRLAEKALKRRVFCFIQQPGEYDEITPELVGRAMGSLTKNPAGQPVAVLLHSPGGDANSAYRLARFLIRHCGGYTVIIPRWAKSAATLFSLGADQIYFGDHAEFGPIDMQIGDPERERVMSALEVVQSLERLNSEALLMVDAMMTHLLRRSQKKVDTILPHVLRYVADITKPIFDKIDTVSFTYHARLLKVGEDYAKMLLRARYPEFEAETIAYSLTRKYPDHGFAIDFEEAQGIGLEIARIPANLREPLGLTLPSYTRNTVVGFLESPHEKAKTKSGKGATGSSAHKREPAASRNGSQRGARDRIGQNGPPESLA
jgi:hypothetical protein